MAERMIFLNILIVGCRRVGANLVRGLDEAGHEVSVLAETQADLDHLNEMGTYRFSGVGFVGIPVDIEVLRNAGIQNVDAVACVTASDNVNLMVAQIAKEMFHIKKVLCRVADPVMKDVFSNEFGLHVICPTNLTVEAFVESLLEDAEISTQSFGSSTIGFIAVDVPKELVGAPLASVPAAEGRLLFGLQHANGIMQLPGAGITLLADDKILWAQPVD